MSATAVCAALALLDNKFKYEGIQFCPTSFPGATKFNWQLDIPLIQNKNLDKNSSRSAFEPAFGRPRRLRYATGTAGHSRVNYLDIQVLKVNYFDVLDLQ